MSEETNKDAKFVNFGVGYSVYKTTVNRKFEMRKSFEPHNPKKIDAFIPGTIVDVRVAVGDEVTTGTILLILDAMKMNNKLFSTISGKVKSINCKAGDRVVKHQVLVELE